MPKNILIINSIKGKNHFLLNLITELQARNYNFFLSFSTEALVNFIPNKDLRIKKINLGAEPYKLFRLCLFTVWLPLRFIKILFILLHYRTSKKVRSVIFLGVNEKLIATPAAKIIGLKIFWLEQPEMNYKKLKPPISWLYRLNAGLAGLIVFSDFGKTQLENFGIKADQIKVIHCGVKPAAYQDNLYNKLAANGQKNFHRKFFTIGTIADLNQKQKVETIMQAAAICLAVVPNLQLIVIGDGHERKNLSWLAKKMRIENIVWFVGEQQQLKKWLDNFDIFIVANDLLKIDDYGNILEAMAAGLPVVAPRYIGLEDIILENKTGSLIEINNCEMMARQIMKLEQDKNLRLSLGKNARERTSSLFTAANMINEFTKLLQ